MDSPVVDCNLALPDPGAAAFFDSLHAQAGATEAAEITTARFFQVLASPIRLEVVRLLLDGERCVGDLTAAMGIAQPRLSNHLACLRHCGLVTTRRHGNFIYYAIADPRVADIARLGAALAATRTQELAQCGVLRQEAVADQPVGA